MKQTLNEVMIPCGCGRSTTGYCIGLHKLSEQEYVEHQNRLNEKLGKNETGPSNHE
jgi:hypothetical protein